jgi:hypothetical protein
MAIAFVYRFLPETKNLSVEEIVATFEHEAQGHDRQRLHPPGPVPRPA